VVVFESGLGEDTSTWHKVQPETATFAHTLVYDRAGLGKSDPSSNPTTVEHMVLELHTLLGAGNIPPPYILVGHSLGGAIVQLFERTYPGEVAGLVLVDPEDGRILERLQARLPKAEWEERQKMLERVMPHFSDAQKAELQAVKASGRALQDAPLRAGVPLVLLTGTQKDPGFPGNPLEQDIKLELHNELLAQLPQSMHVLVPNSRHYIQEDAPERVIDAIREVLRAWNRRAAERLSP